MSNSKAVDVEEARIQQELAQKVRATIEKRQKEERAREKGLKKKNLEGATDAAPNADAERPLKVEMVELYALNNANEHHTDKYELVTMDPPSPVLRRGQAFYMAVGFFKRSYNPATDKVKVVFSFGPRPNAIKGTQAEILLQDKDAFTQPLELWDVRIHHKEGNNLTLHIRIPANAPVGLWKCRILCTLENNPDKKRRHDCNEDIYILFNPWCKEDSVYMENQSWCREFVLNDVGKIYIGNYNKPMGRHWVFGQFDDIVLPSCEFLLERSGLRYTTRWDPIRVVRAISAIVNSRDDNGLLEDNWSGKYEGGTNPAEWTGSLKVLEEYMSTGGTPVKFGQCWVYSGLVTTICRALGIPCRSVTCFVSAHDCDESLTIDKYHDHNGELKPPEEGDTQDSIWNFHVWNEVFMSRPDLAKGYGGWQVIDATPQEQSRDIYRTGPASVEAVRRGEIEKQYDTMFVLSEVNADIVHWQDDETSEWGRRRMKILSHHIGRKILTRHHNKIMDDAAADAEDITLMYKSPEGSEGERMQLLHAARQVGLFHIHDIPELTEVDVCFDMLEIDRILIGQPFEITVKIQNKSTEVRTIFAIMSASTIYYTGVQAKQVKRSQTEFVMQPSQSEVISIRILPEEYLDKLVDYSMMKIYTMAKVKETQQTWAEEDDFNVDKPALDLKVKGKIQVGGQFNIICSFTNPLAMELEKCHFSFEGPGLTRPKLIPFRDVRAGESVTHEETFVPLQCGERTIVATFGSSRLTELYGSTAVIVLANA